MKKFFVVIIFAAAACFVSAAVAPCRADAAEVLQEITVREGDTLWGIANFYLKDTKRWPEILKHNPQLSNDPNIVLPGMRLQVPIILIKEHLRAAYLVYILQDVRYRRRKEAEWKRAWSNMELYEEDGVRTLEKSQAHVKLPSGELLRLFENSLLIVKPERSQDEVELVAGEVRASKTRIITADTVVKPQITPKTEAPDFKTRLKADKTTMVEVYKGAIDVTAQGKTVTVSEGFGTEVKFRKTPSIPVRLPEMPDLKIDAAGAHTQTARDGKIELTVAPPDLAPGTPKTSGDAGGKRTGEERGKIIGSAVKKYRMQISTARAFGEIVHEEVKELKNRISLEFTAMNLSDGLYFWRVAYIDQLGFEGRFSEPRSFLIDTKPPELSLSSPEDGAEYDTEFIYVEGKTEPGAAITVNDVSTNVEQDGKFLYAILAKEGVIGVKVIATDTAGNQTAAERTVMKVKKGAAKKRAAVEPGNGPKRKPAASITLPIAILTISVIIGVILIIVKP